MSDKRYPSLQQPSPPMDNTVTDNAAQDDDMSMDEILASIRRYVSNDDPARNNQQKRGNPPPPAPDKKSEHIGGTTPLRDFKEESPPNGHAPAAYFAAPPKAASSTGPLRNTSANSQQDDVVRLYGQQSQHNNTPPHNQTQVPSQTSPSFANLGSGLQGPSTQPKMSPTSFSHTPSPPPVTHTFHPSQTPVASSASLLSEKTLQSTAQAFDTLSKIAHESKTPLETPTYDRPKLTLEDMFAHMARPMIQEWLEINLPLIVEKAIKKEIDIILEKARH